MRINAPGFVELSDQPVTTFKLLIATAVVAPAPGTAKLETTPWGDRTNPYMYSPGLGTGDPLLKTVKVPVIKPASLIPKNSVSIAPVCGMLNGVIVPSCWRTKPAKFPTGGPYQPVVVPARLMANGTTPSEYPKVVNIPPG